MLRSHLIGAPISLDDFYILVHDISPNKILTELTKVKLKDTKITPYRAYTMRQIPLRYQA